MFTINFLSASNNFHIVTDTTIAYFKKTANYRRADWQYANWGEPWLGKMLLAMPSGIKFF